MRGSTVRTVEYSTRICLDPWYWDESGALDLLAQLLPWLECMATHTYNSSNPKVEAGGSKAKG